MDTDVETTAGTGATAGSREGPRVTIACQGGGSHTAFTAGVLDRLLAEEDVAFDVVGLTGTSGGAICAFVTWYALASEGRVAGRATARRLLAAVWDDLAARDPVDGWANAVGVGTARAAGAGLPLATASPYDTPVADWSRATLRATLERAVDPDDLAALVGRAAADALPPRLEVGAADVQRGTFRTFTERDVTHDAVLASAAVPTLFRAAPVVGADGATRYYWDGLFSQNPPLGELRVASEGRLDRADELWIVQINPRRDERLPRTVEAIADRRNELGGNLSVNQELATIRELNGWYAEGALGGTYRPVEVRTINLEESTLSPGRPLDYASKLDRSPAHLERLWAHGRAQAERFLAVERDRRRVAGTVATTWGGVERVETATGTGTDAAVAPDAVVHLPTSLLELRRYLRDEPEAAEPSVDWASYREFAGSLRESIGNLRVGVEEVVAEPTRVALRWRGTGVHDGPLAGVEPTGRPVTLSGMSLYRLADGRIVEAWILTEQWSLLRQLDVADPAAPLSTASRVSATPVVTELSAPAENEAVAREEVAAVWNEGDREALARLVDEDVRTHFDDGSDPLGRDAYRALVRRYRDAFPDLSVAVEDAVAEGDKVVLRLRLRGTHEGPFLGVAPTGRRVDVARMAIVHLDDGRIVESGLVEDTVRLVHQFDAPAKEVVP